MNHFKRVILFFIDGANEKVFRKLLADGELPNISKHIASKGSSNKAIACFPSTTGPAFTPTMTGCLPGTCNIPGVRWFDRSIKTKTPTMKRFRNYYDWGIYKYDGDLSKKVKTLYEYIPNSVSILGFLNRGAKLNQKTHFFKAPFIFYRALYKDDVQYVESQALKYFKKQEAKKRPQFVFYYFPIIDLLSHVYKKDSKEVIACYRRIDKDVGEVVKVLKTNGTYDETAFILTSDHGHDDVESHFDVDGYLSERYEKAMYYPKKFRGWRKANAINMVAGNGMTHIYLRNGKSWQPESYFEDMEAEGLVDELLAKKEVQIAMGRSKKGGIYVKSLLGKARIKEVSDQKICYRPTSSDPFGLPKIPDIISHDEALALTAKTDFPDAILQTVQLFRSKRTGDLILSAREKSDLRAGHFERPEHKSCHGSLHPEHMFVPLITNFKIKDSLIRTVDIFPTILASIGLEAKHKIDGKKLEIIS